LVVVAVELLDQLVQRPTLRVRTVVLAAALALVKEPLLLEERQLLDKAILAVAEALTLLVLLVVVAVVALGQLEAIQLLL
jgi:hypothetical protein